MSDTPHKPDLLPAHVYAGRRDWRGYFDALASLPPRDTLLRALALRAGPPGHALDVGCGDGRDAAHLASLGWTVLAIDSSEEGLRRLHERLSPDLRARVRTQLAPFDRMTPEPADLVCASFSLPFCEPAHFPALWQSITSSLRPGGFFAGQLFGDRDDWASLPDRTHHSPDAARALFRDFDILFWQEEDRESRVDPARHPKHWHVYHIVARKRA
ncbi:MAG: class I SAM-dependent methyltransferase [Leptolyngbya sp. PLA1]|nr:class I SAM-dependent methyltransferase [Leptolyngbya sp. PLA1]